MRRSSFPPKLREFVDAVEERAATAGYSTAKARIYGAWSACYVRYCTLNDYSWRDPDPVPSFLDYLEERQDVDSNSRSHATEALLFLFEDLLKMELGAVAWHPDRQPDEPEAAEEDEAEEGEQGTLLTRLLFHTSLPINEALDLCVGDVDLDAGLIYVSDPMGTPKRIVEVPDPLREPLREHIDRLREEHGPSYFDASLFQARALQGRVDESGGDGSTSAPPSSTETSSPEPSETQASSDEDGPSSLWGYAEEEESA